MSELRDITRRGRLEKELRELNANIEMYGKKHTGKQRNETLREYAKRVFFVALHTKAEDLLWVDFDSLLFVPIDSRRVLVIDSDNQAEHAYIVTEYVTGRVEVAEFLENASVPMHPHVQIENLQEILH